MADTTFAQFDAATQAWKTIKLHDNGDGTYSEQPYNASEAAAATVLGTTADAAVVTDANGTVSAKLRGLIKLLVDQITVKLAAGTNTIGATTDGGSSWTAAHVVFHGDASSVQDISAAPASGQKRVLTDLIISTAAACEVTIKEETSGTVMHGPFLMPANGNAQFTTRSRMSKLATADKKYQVISSTADHITCEAWTYSEA